MTILEIRDIKSTRKPWRCDGCHRQFTKGTPKQRSRIIGDNGPYSIQWCLTCQGIANQLFDLDSDYRDFGVNDHDILEAMQCEFGTWEAADTKFGETTELNHEVKK